MKIIQGQGISQGMVPLIGFTYASGNRKRMKDSIRTAFILSLSTACICTILLLAMAGPVARLFIDDNETASYGTEFLRIIALACPSTMINFMIISNPESSSYNSYSACYCIKNIWSECFIFSVGIISYH